MEQNNITNEVKAYLIDKVNDYNGTSSYGCDLAYKLTEGVNANGSVYCNTDKTKELIKENWDLFVDFIEHYANEFESQLTPFLEPEKTHVCFLICAVEQILSSCDIISKHWDSDFELNKKNSKKLIEQINKFTKITF